MALDNTQTDDHSGPVEPTSVIPEGCEQLWHADLECVDPDTVLRRAAERAAKGRPQAVLMPNGETIILHPRAA